MSFAEFIGTAIFVLMACGTCVSTSKENDSFVSTALSFGLVIVCIASALGEVSGAHLNPAVTIGLLCNGKINFSISIVYIISQFLGAICGSGLLSGILPRGHQDLCPTTVSTELTPFQAILIEMIITYMLVLVVCSVSHKNSNIAPLAIGFSVTVGHLFAIPLTSASMNTARSFGPSLVSSNWDNQHVYWIGPFIGGALAGLSHRVFLINQKENEVD